jgi:hypothetical protein
MAQVRLGLVAQGGWQRCDIAFPNAAVALATLRRWRAEDEAAGHPYSQVWAEETEELQVYPKDRVGPLTEDEIALLDFLYPSCEHGLSADLCMGPNHYPTADQERAMGW